MRYCEHCKSIVDTEGNCPVCGCDLTSLLPESEVCVATVKGSSVSMLEATLKDAGIPCRFSDVNKDIYNEYNAKVSAESDNMVTVPFELYNKAFDICLGFGFVEEGDRLVPVSEGESEDTRTYDEKFEQVSGMKHSKWQTAWTVLFIIAACLVIWGIDWIAEFIKSLF